MEETRRSLFSLATVCCLLAGVLLPPPGDGQTQLSLPPSTVTNFKDSLLEASSQSPQTIVSAVTGMAGKSTATSQLNASASSSPDLSAPTTDGFLNITTGPQTISSRNADNLTANSADGNQSSYADLVTSTSWTSSSNFTTDPFQSTEIQGTTATSQPKSSTFITLATTEKTPETLPAVNHETIREVSTAESTSPSFTVTDESVPTPITSTTTRSTPELASTSRSYRTTPGESKRLTDNAQEKTSGLHTGDFGENLPSTPTDGPVGEDPLVIAVIFIFIVTVGILALMGFLRYRQRNSRLQFRRLHDLPMDDMMEDTPLSLYSY